MALNWIDIVTLIIGSLFGYLSFVIHEWGHIKSQGPLMSGTIRVEKYTMTATADIVYNTYLFFLGGGLISGIIFMLLGFGAALYGVWGYYVPFFTTGVIQLVYGFWEAEVGAKNRYYVYASTLLVMICFWYIHYVVFIK